jgi:hypothetical protein
VFSHSRRPTSALAMSTILTLLSPLEAAALRSVALNVETTVSLAQSASRFQTPQPPIVCRVKPVCG